jgi:predicted lactoylglutathione lyase
LTFLKDILRTNIKGEITDPQNANEVVFTLSAESKDQVDNWLKEVEKAKNYFQAGRIWKRLLWFCFYRP